MSVTNSQKSKYSEYIVVPDRDLAPVSGFD